jgi:hypothetical protein
LDSSS